MASHKRPTPFRARTGRLITAAGAAAASVTVLAPAARAEPDPGPEQIRAEVDRLYRDAEQATQRYDGAKEQSAALQREVSRLQDELARRTDAVDAIRTRLGALAAEQYRTGAFSPAMQLLLTDDPRRFLERSDLLHQAGEAEQAALREYAHQRAVLDTRTAEAEARLADLTEQQRQLAAQRAVVQQKLAQAQSLLARLTAADRTALNRASRDAFRPGDLVPAVGRAALAIAFAQAQLGKPYVWGATGPGSYDCSGLMQAAWRSAGVSLPRTTYEQIDAAPRVSRAELRPGDLVFFFSDISHVGMYVGNGRMIHAPHPGAPVRYESIDVMPFAGAVRPA